MTTIETTPWRRADDNATKFPVGVVVALVQDAPGRSCSSTTKPTQRNRNRGGCCGDVCVFVLVGRIIMLVDSDPQGVSVTLDRSRSWIRRKPRTVEPTILRNE